LPTLFSPKSYTNITYICLFYFREIFQYVKEHIWTITNTSWTACIPRCQANALRVCNIQVLSGACNWHCGSTICAWWSPCNVPPSLAQKSFCPIG
jgi:hypothetical protein